MKKLSLNIKMSFVFGLMTVTCGVIAWVGLSSMARIEANLERIASHYAVRVQESNEMQSLIRLLVSEEKELLLEDDREGKQALAQQMDRYIVDFEKIQQQLLDTSSDDGRIILARIGDTFKRWKGSTLEIRGLSQAGNDAEATGLSRGRGKELRRDVETQIAGYLDYNSRRMKDAARQAEQDYTRSRNLMLIVSFGLILSSLLVAAFVLRAVSKAINRVISSLSDNSGQVASASRQIAAASEGLSQSTTEQASSLEETAAAVEELTSMVRRNADAAKSSSSLAQDSTASAQRGKQVVNEMKQAMSEINVANDAVAVQIAESNERISEIVKVISDIGNKTKVINDIVFQTKLLSFNASVEAARAGEHGKGFAVVAEEVGNLAQMSGNAAKEISSMLGASVHKVETIVAETKTKVSRLLDDGRSRTALGAQVAATCGEVLDEIVGNISQLAESSREIAAASDEQARGVSEISKAVAQLDQVTQQNASASEEAASAAEQLAAQAVGLQSVIGLLSVTIRGGTEQPYHDAGVSRNEPVTTQARTTPSHSTFTTPNGRVVHLRARTTQFSGAGRPGPSGNLAHDLNAVPAEDDPRFKEI